jgi:hypothetical protein
MAATMGGCNAHFENHKKSQGAKRVTPGTFARNNLSQGGVNTDLGGSAKSGIKQPLGKGKADANTMKGRK